MNRVLQLLQFTLDEQRYALLLSVVERIVRAAEITPLPKAPEIVLGVLNVHGAVIPAVNIRKRFNIPERAMGISDHLVIARTIRRMVALPVDAVLGVLEYPEEHIVKAEQIIPHLDYTQGVLKLDDGLTLIHDLDTFLSLEEHLALDEAMK